MNTRTLFPLFSTIFFAALGGNAVAHGTHVPSPTPKSAAPRTYTLLDHGDVEGVSFAFTNGKWDLHIDDLLHGIGYDPAGAIVRVLEAAKTAVPANASYSFLGTPGAPIWLLPQSADEAAALGVVALGHSAASIAPGTFTSEITLQLTALAFTPEPGITEAGHFSLFSNDGLGVPTVRFDSRDGISVADALTIAQGEHRHFNWAFSQPGLYKLTQHASATRNGATVTDTKTFTYRVRSAGAPFTLWSVGETFAINGVAARIAGLGLPAVHGATRAAVRAILAGTGFNATNNTAILLRADGDTTVFARTGNAAPDLPGTRFHAFGDPAIGSTGLMSFVATLVPGAGGVTAGNDAALIAQYVPTGGGTALGIAWREGLTAPGPTGFRFTQLNWFFPSGDGFVLSAKASNGRVSGNGVYRVSFTNGVPVFTMLIMEGQPFLTDLALKTPRTIGFPTAAPHPGGTARAVADDGTVTLLVVFGDGSREILQFTTPAP